MDNILYLDVETTAFVDGVKTYGHPFNPENFMCTIQVMSSTDMVPVVYKFQYPDTSAAVGETIQIIEELISAHDVLVGFNIKFDLHWLNRYGMTGYKNKRIEDVQYMFFLLQSQQARFPSLNQVADYLGLPQKIDVVKTEYWDQGIDTSQVPFDVLEEYGAYDVKLTQLAHQSLTEELSDRGDVALINNLSVHMVDLLVLQEMEFNGMMYDTVEAEKVREDTENKITAIDAEFADYVPEGVADFNPGSNDQLSVILFGGTLYQPYYELIGKYKTGKRAGEDKFSPRVKEIEVKRLINPQKKWETKKEGYYSVAADILEFLSKKQKGIAKRIVDLALDRASLQKLLSSYCNSIANLITSNKWEVKNGLACIHGTLNQCVAITGRLASSKPNLQNMDGNIKYLFVTRYPNGSTS